MRFDDSLKTVLSADGDSGAAANSTWRQLVDLIGRGRIPGDADTIGRLRTMRAAVPLNVRAASGRAMAFATPGAALVAFFAEDEIAVAAPVLRTAVLPAADWSRILPELAPQGRAILRHRRDLPAEIVRALETFGSTDFVLADASLGTSSAYPDAKTKGHDATPLPPPDTPRSATPFLSLADIARGLPMVAEAMRRSDARTERRPAADVGTFEIVDIVARIDAFRRARESSAGDAAPPPDRRAAQSFRFETDRAGVMNWVDGIARGGLIGASIARSALQGNVRFDTVVQDALHRRSPFAGATLTIDGEGDSAGEWRISGSPMFDQPMGRFAGMRGIARRVAVGQGLSERAEPSTDSDSLRQLVHELRTPTNAISGFAELIEAELLGPVAPAYRQHAASIRRQATTLSDAIDDLDTAARIDGRALEARASRQSLAPLVERAIADTAEFTALRGATIEAAPLGDANVDVDERLAVRLLSRLLAALASAAAPGERIALRLLPGRADETVLALSRPRAIADLDETALLRIDADAASGVDGAPLLGIGFALRLARNLARELGGVLHVERDRLTLRLPAAVIGEVGQAVN